MSSSSSLYHIPLGAVVYCAYITLFLSSILIPSRIPYRDIIQKKGSKSILYVCLLNYIPFAHLYYCIKLLFVCMDVVYKSICSFVKCVYRIYVIHITIILHEREDEHKFIKVMGVFP